VKDKTRDTLLIVTLTLLIRLLKDDAVPQYAIEDAEEVAQQAINEMTSKYGER